jgi:hypothetical protein
LIALFASRLLFLPASFLLFFEPPYRLLLLAIFIVLAAVVPYGHINAPRHESMQNAFRRPAARLVARLYAPGPFGVILPVAPDGG